VVGGERCSTPIYLIERKVYQMIDDLPLNDEQKSELRQYVAVCGGNIRPSGKVVLRHGFHVMRAAAG
jgi:hypothetical protein